MARYWASKNSVPAATEGEQKSQEYCALISLNESMRGLTIDQHAPDLGGGFEMLCALQYHYMNFVQIVKKKSLGELPFDASDERFEAVSYIGRIGQLKYFSQARFVSQLVHGFDDKSLVWLSYLEKFRHKYSAHRERDKPKKNTDEANSLSGELALGALGGSTFSERYPGAFDDLRGRFGDDIKAYQARQHEYCYLVYTLYVDGADKSFVPEYHHQFIFQEVATFLARLIDQAKALPRE